MVTTELTQATSLTHCTMLEEIGQLLPPSVVKVHWVPLLLSVLNICLCGVWWGWRIVNAYLQIKLTQRCRSVTPAHWNQRVLNIQFTSNFVFLYNLFHIRSSLIINVVDTTFLKFGKISNKWNKNVNENPRHLTLLYTIMLLANKDYSHFRYVSWNIHT